MPTEVWMRNPSNYIREVVEVGHCWMAWDRGFLVKRGHLDVNTFADANVPVIYSYRNLIIGEQGAAETDRTTKLRAPRAVYPVWDYTENHSSQLIHLLENPVGEDPKWYNNARLLPDQRPIQGQEHRVVVIRPPDFNGSAASRAFYLWLREQQEKYPDAIIHLHGSYSFRAMFGLGFRSADLDPANDRGTKMSLPMGRECKRADASKYQQWVALVGSRLSELNDAKGVCKFNIRSALWAGQHWDELVAFKTARGQSTSPFDSATLDAYSPGPAVTFEDKFICNRCSLATSCKYYRDGAVCSLPGSESVELSKFFTSRDSDVILVGLTRLLEFQTERLMDGREAEKLTGDLDPEVTRIADSVFERALKLAKILNPSLDPKRPLVQVNSSGPTQVNAGASVNMQELVAKAFTELEARGIPRDQITTEMVEQHMLGRPLSIPAKVVE